MPITTERGKIAHLLRRAGFSPSASELDAAQAKGRDALLDELLNPQRVPDDAEAALPSGEIDYSRPVHIPLWWLQRMVLTKRPFQEKLTLFWHGHLTSGLGRVGQLRFTVVAQNELFRRQGLGNVRDLLLEVSKDPAMILYLDNNTNRKGKPNENYARELFELFTLGRGNYTEGDIREAARAFTGWFQRGGVFQFAANQHDSDAKTVFGRTGNWDGGDIVRMAVEHPAAGPFLSRKLWEFFVYENPEPAVVSAISEVYYRSGFDMRAVMRAIFTHPAFYSEKAYHALVKSPTELTIGLLRSLDASMTLDLSAEQRLQLANQMNGAAAAMGQTLFNPPNVGGWPGGEDWVSTTAMITRYNVANAISRDAWTGIAIDPAAMLARKNLTRHDEIVDYFVELMVDGDLTARQRQTLLDYMLQQDNGRPGAWQMDEASVTKKVRGLIYLIATTPQYQLA